MNRSRRIASTHHLSLSAATLLALCACATTPTPGAPVVGEEALLEAEVVQVDTTPWTYDGNAVVTVSSAAAGTVRVQLPARWNLCKAQPLDDVQALKPGDRVQVSGTVTAKGEVVVCEQAQHRRRKVD